MALKTPSDRLLELDVLRGLAALSILLYHYTVIYPMSYNPNEETLFRFVLGGFATHLFFIISGFVIFMTLEKVDHPFDFIVSRFSRLFPCYWIAIPLTFVVVKKFSLFPSSLMAISPKDALINLSMLQYWFHVKSVDGVYWTLELELSFYFLMFLIFITKGMKYIEVFGALWLVLMVFNRFFVPVWPVLITLKTVFWYLLRSGHLFFAGILFYNLKARGNAWYRHVGIASCLLVQYLIAVEGEKAAFVPFVFFFLIFYMFIYGRLSFVIQKPLLFLGTISYSLYLTHSVIGFVIKQWLDVLQADMWLKFFIPLIAALMIATLMTYGIEKPAMNLIRRSYKNWKKR